MKKVYSRFVSLLLALAMVIAVFPVISFAANDEMSLKVSTVSGCPGESVQVTVELSGNPGIASLKFDVSFDEAYLTLTGVTFAEGFGSYVTAPEPFKSPQTISLISPLAAITTNGFFATLSFAISSEAPDGAASAITVTYDEDDVFDSDYNTISLNITNGLVNIYEGIPGDIDGDKKVNNKDAILLFRYVAGWSVTVDSGALDVNGDGKVNNKDAITLFRYVAGWPDITLVRGTVCTHSLEATEAKAATCTDSGNIAYWHCLTCGRYYRDANATKEITLADTVEAALGHTPVTDPAVPPTTTAEGLTEGSHCAVCGTVLVAQQSIPKLEVKEHAISFDIANGDTYLEGLLEGGDLVNNNPSVFREEEGLTLKNLSVKGYRFLGWYDGAGSNAVQIKKIEAGTTEDVELYAHWEKITYTVQFKSSLYLDENEITYTVDTGALLPTPKLSNYIFTGWTDEDGKLFASKKIPEGTTGNITLTANWTSERNRVLTNTTLGKPIVEIDEENNVILLAYEIGQVINVPLYTIKDFGYISGDGVTKTEQATYSVTVNESAMEAYTKLISNATTQSSNWTLSESWNETTNIDESWCTEHGIETEEAETVAKSDTETWNISSGSSGSTDTTKLSTHQHGVTEEVKLSSGETNSVSDKTSAGLEVNGGWSAGSSAGLNLNVDVSADYTLEHGYSATANKTQGAEGNESWNDTNTTVTSSSWNSGSSYGGSSSNSISNTNSKVISDRICETYGYGKSYVTGGTSSNTQGLSSCQSASDEYSASVTYSTATAQEVSSSWTTQSTKPGYHRWVVAGTAHVFAVVGYDMATKSYFVYTYSVLDDETHEFEDYSYVSSEYNDEQNGVISFEIPYDIADYVAELTCYSKGLKVNQETGTITGYSGTDCFVVIPEYMNVGNGKVIKITGISSTAFQGNTGIEEIHLSDYITEIPADALKGCTSLIYMTGGAIKTIGDSAFSGCSGIELFGLNSKIVSLGDKAFENVGRLLVNASNIDVLCAAAHSGAKAIDIYTSLFIGDTDQHSDIIIDVPAGTESFAFNGSKKTYDIQLKSDAKKTVLSDAIFVCTDTIPIQISSPEVEFNALTVQAAGIAMVLSATNTNIGLIGTNTVQSDNTNALLCKNATLYETNPQVDGKLVVIKKILVCGDVTNKNFLTYDEYETIDETTFNNMLNSYTLYFDANGGSCSESSRKVPNSTPIGNLPTHLRGGI